MTRRISVLRKSLPLPLRRGYGWVRRQACLHPVWDHPEFRRWYERLLESQWRSLEQIEADQLFQLRRLIEHAYRNVPYYRRTFDERRLKPGDLRSLEDLAKFPILTKQIVRENLDDLVARNYDRGLLRYKTTSGSTGDPLGLYDEGLTSSLHEDAFRYRQWSWAGYLFGDRVANLRYAVSRPDRRGRNTCWDFTAGENVLQLSPFGVDEEIISRYVSLLHEFNPRFINAIPSCLEILARFTRKNQIALPQVEAIFCESENVYPWQRALFEEQFCGRVFAGYGHSERCVDAVECEQHEGYDVSMEYGILELLDPQGEPVRGPGQTGRVVGTGFDTMAMPMIRYLTDDLAVLAPRRCSCGRAGTRIQEIQGRASEYVVTRSGVLMSLPALYGTIHSPVLAEVREFRFLQERAGELIICLVPSPGTDTARLERELLSEIYRRIDGGALSFEIRILESLPRNRSGKAGLLEQRLPVSFEDIAGT